MAGSPSAMNETEQRGWELFSGKAQCTLCHAGQTLSDSDFHNLGVGIGNERPDLGRFGITGAEEERAAFKTPTLRDISRTAPYMHDGSQETLEEVLEFYNRGGEPNPRLDPRMKALDLTDEEIQDIIAFLKALDGEIPNPVGPPG